MLKPEPFSLSLLFSTDVIFGIYLKSSFFNLYPIFLIVVCHSDVRDVLIHFFLKDTFSLKVLDCIPSLLTFSLLCIFLFCHCSARHLSTCLTPGPSMQLLMCINMFNIYLGESDLGLPLSYFLFLSLFKPAKKNTVLFLCLWVLFLKIYIHIYIYTHIILSGYVPLFPHFFSRLIFFLTFLHFLFLCHSQLPLSLWSFAAFSAQFPS